MGLLHRPDDDTRRTLSARCLVGRAEACTLRLVERSVSGEHAVIAWSGSGWTVRDLGSRNGTFVADTRLGAGIHPLPLGAELRFGRGRPWMLTDGGPPVATARDPLTGDVRAAEGDLLALPDSDAPRVMVYERADGSWVAEVDGEPVEVVDGAAVSDGERSWVLHLPTTLERTWDAGDEPWALEELHLDFAHSPDEEHVDLTLRHPFGERCPKRFRVHHYTLMLLARAWLADDTRSAADRGWVHAEDLCQMLRIDELKLNVEVYRARKEFAALGVLGAAEVVQRRRGSKQLRIGVPRLTVRCL